MTNEYNTAYSSGTDENQPHEFHPWRRYLARMIDFAICSLLWTTVLALVFNMNIEHRSNGENLLDTFMAIALMLLIEPLLLHIFSTTPGKAIFGISVKEADGTRLSYARGLARTWGVIGQGMGFNIPIYNVVCLWRCYKACQEHKNQLWDFHITYTFKDTARRRWLYFAVACAAWVTVLFTIQSAQLLPPHRGELTIPQFVENHNYYAKYYGLNFGREYLDESGVWREKENNGNDFYIEFGYNGRPEYVFSLADGYVQGVSFVVEEENFQNWLSSLDDYMILATLALAGAKDEMGLFSKLPEQIISEIQDHKFQNHQFTTAGMNIEFTCEYSGYELLHNDFLIPLEGGTKQHYRLSFSVSQ